MEKSFDFGSLLRHNEKKHKGKPTQFVSVAGGIKKRLESNIQNRKSNRCTTFDSTRNLPANDTPAKPDAQSKVEHRRQQLEKWRLEKEQKKKEAAAKKKKPFVTGVAHASIKFVPPPPPKPSTTGRVTRSQTKNSTAHNSSPKKSRSIQSFAPKHAKFRPPEIKNVTKLPTLAPPSKIKNKKFSTVTFDPVLPNKVVSSTQPTRSKTETKTRLEKQTSTEIKKDKPQIETRSRGKIVKRATPKPNRVLKKLESTSSSDIEPHIEPSMNPVVMQSTGSRRSITKGPKIAKVLAFSSTSDEKSSDVDVCTDDNVNHRSRGKPLNIPSASSSDKLSSESQSSFEEKRPSFLKKQLRKSLPKNFKSSETIASSNSEQSSEEKSPVLLKTPVKFLEVSNRVPRSESSSEEKLRSPKSPIELSLTLEQMEMAVSSPCITLSRGKDNARKEMKWKLDEGLLDEDSSDAENVEHFRGQLDSEIKRITEMCATWDKISEQTPLPDAVQEAVLAAVGQARLLMSSKLQQFASLISRCAASEPGAALVTPADLQGFWDMVFIQVENVDMRFKKLEELRARGWAEDIPVETRNKVVGKRHATKRTAKPAGASKIRDMIAAARKAKKEQESASSVSPSSESSVTSTVAMDSPLDLPEYPGKVPGHLEIPEDPEKVPSPGNVPKSPSNVPKSPNKIPKSPNEVPKGPSKVSKSPGDISKGSEVQKTFEGGFFVVRSPVRSPRSTPTTPNKSSLLKAVLSSEAKKSAAKKCASILRASLLAKNVEFDGISLLPQTPEMTRINLYATPGRSILKSTTNSTTKSNLNKSIKIVLFNQPDQNESSTSGSDKMDTARDNSFANERSSPIDGVEELEEDIETLSEIQVKEKLMNQDEVMKKSVLVSKNAIEETPIMTRSRRRSQNRTEKTPKVDEKEKKSTKKSRKSKTLDDENKTRKSARIKELTTESIGDEIVIAKKKAVEQVITESVSEEVLTRSAKKKAGDMIKLKVHRELSAQTSEESIPEPRQTRRKSRLQEISEKSPRSAQKKTLQEIQVNKMDEVVPTPKSSRRRKSAGVQNVVT